MALFLAVVERAGFLLLPAATAGVEIFLLLPTAAKGFLTVDLGRGVAALGAFLAVDGLRRGFLMELLGLGVIAVFFFPAVEGGARTTRDLRLAAVAGVVPLFLSADFLWAGVAVVVPEERRFPTAAAAALGVAEVEARLLLVLLLAAAGEAFLLPEEEAARGMGSEEVAGLAEPFQGERKPSTWWWLKGGREGGWEGGRMREGRMVG